MTFCSVFSDVTPVVYRLYLLFLWLDGAARLWMPTCSHSGPPFSFILQPSLLHIVLVTDLLHNSVSCILFSLETEIPPSFLHTHTFTSMLRKQCRSRGRKECDSYMKQFPVYCISNSPHLPKQLYLEVITVRFAGVEPS